MWLWRISAISLALLEVVKSCFDIMGIKARICKLSQGPFVCVEEPA